MQISTSEGTKIATVDTFFSRIRLSVILSFRMMSNSVIKIDDGKVELYTENKVSFFYPLVTSTASESGLLILGS